MPLRLTRKEAEDEIGRLTDELEAKRDMMTDADFMKEVTIYKNKCEETYTKLTPIHWLIYKKVKICNVVIKLCKTPIVYNSKGLDDQSLRALVRIAEIAKSLGDIDDDRQDCYINAEKIKIEGMRYTYKVCFHTKATNE